MKSHIPLVAALTFLGAGWISAADTSADTNLSAPAAMPGDNAAIDTHNNPKDKVDQKFVDHAAMGGLYEVESSRLALEKNVPDRVRDFAQKMIDDHTKINDHLKDLAGRLGYGVPANLDHEHQKMLDKLRGYNGDDFVKAYDREQVKGHDETISLFNKEVKDGKDADLKQFAQETLPVLHHHRDMLNGMPYVEERSSWWHFGHHEGGSQSGAVPAGDRSVPDQTSTVPAGVNNSQPAAVPNDGTTNTTVVSPGSAGGKAGVEPTPGGDYPNANNSNNGTTTTSP